MTGTALAEAVTQVATAAGRDDTLPVLTGIQLALANGKLTLSATDRYRFAVRTIDWHAINEAIQTATALLPARSLTETVKMLGHANQIRVTLPGQNGVLGLADPARSTTARVIDGQLPDHRKLWPTRDIINTTALVDTEELAAAIKRVALVVGATRVLQLTVADGGLSLQAGTSDDAQAVDTVAAQCDGGLHNFTIAFNPTLLLDGITALGTPKTALWMTERTKPALLTGAESSVNLSQLTLGGDDLQYLLMPIRLST